MTTNYEHIKNMTFEEMIEFILDTNSPNCNYCISGSSDDACKNCFGDQVRISSSIENCKQWLESETTE